MNVRFSTKLEIVYTKWQYEKVLKLMHNCIDKGDLYKAKIHAEVFDLFQLNLFVINKGEL